MQKTRDLQPPKQAGLPAGAVQEKHIKIKSQGAGIGIKTSSSRENFILKNTSTGHIIPYDLDSDDTFGPHVTASGSLIGTNPWANFSR